MSDDINRFGETLSESLDTMETAQAGSAQDLRNLQTASRAALQTELRRATARYGAEDPKTLRVKSLVARNETTLRMLETRSELAEIKPAPRVEGEVLIEGRLADTKGRAIPRMSVALADEKGNRIRQIEPVTAEAGGYFAIRIEESKAARLREAYPGGVYPLVLSSRGATLHVGQEAAALEPAKAKFMQVELDRSDWIRPEPVTPSRDAGARAEKKQQPRKK